MYCFTLVYHVRCYLLPLFDERSSIFHSLPKLFLSGFQFVYFYNFSGQISRAEDSTEGKSKPSRNTMALPHSWSPITFPTVLCFASPPSRMLEGFHGALHTGKLTFFLPLSEDKAMPLNGLNNLSLLLTHDGTTHTSLGNRWLALFGFAVSHPLHLCPPVTSSTSSLSSCAARITLQSQSQPQVHRHTSRWEQCWMEMDGDLFPGSVPQTFHWGAAGNQSPSPEFPLLDTWRTK